MDDLPVWLAAVLLLIIAAAAAGMIPLRRYADREWAEHQRMQRIMSLPEMVRLARDFERMRIQIGEALRPGMLRGLQELAKVLAVFAALQPPRARWKRALDRLYVGRWIR